MARLVLCAMAVSLVSVSAAAQAADQKASPWHDFRDPTPAPSFDIPNDPDAGPARSAGSRIFAGTEVIPNTVIGIGMFGPKAEKSAHAPAVARDLAVPKARKAAVGFSFKF